MISENNFVIPNTLNQQLVEETEDEYKVTPLSDPVINQTIEVDHKTRIQDSYLLLNVLLGPYAFETNYISEMINLAGQIH
ncbi:unnamed protein product [Macrosiphum euphorbiae]|uniref:Uncharacterized protein n=1 Tax=Macrosiphum euphorbiae TaxID=13131 RepID=A0AAV0WRQ0_9HEMI|nr:unnamed protein product [Macrosiphum euphorbiae]